MAKEDLGKSIGKGAIPLDRLDFVITKLGESFKSPYHALRQYIDNAKDAIKLRRDYGNSSENLIIIYANREDKSIRIIDHGPGIIEDSPIFETPSGKSIFDKNSQSIEKISIAKLVQEINNEEVQDITVKGSELDILLKNENKQSSKKEINEKGEMGFTIQGITISPCIATVLIETTPR